MLLNSSVKFISPHTPSLSVVNTYEKKKRKIESILVGYERVRVEF